MVKLGKLKLDSEGRIRGVPTSTGRNEWLSKEEALKRKRLMKKAGCIDLVIQRRYPEDPNSYEIYGLSPDREEVR